MSELWWHCACWLSSLIKSDWFYQLRPDFLMFIPYDGQKMIIDNSPISRLVDGCKLQLGMFHAQAPNGNLVSHFPKVTGAAVSPKCMPFTGN